MKFKINNLEIVTKVSMRKNSFKKKHKHGKTVSVTFADMDVELDGSGSITVGQHVRFDFGDFMVIGLNRANGAAKLRSVTMSIRHEMFSFKITNGFIEGVVLGSYISYKEGIGTEPVITNLDKNLGGIRGYVYTSV